MALRIYHTTRSQLMAYLFCYTSIQNITNTMFDYFISVELCINPVCLYLCCKVSYIVTDFDSNTAKKYNRTYGRGKRPCSAKMLPKSVQTLYYFLYCKRRRFVKMHVAENSNPLLFTNNVHRLISKINSLLYFAANRDFSKFDVVCL